MKILIFTEGTIIISSSKEKPRDYASYFPVKDAVNKIINWKNQGHEISYITSRKKREEIEIIKNILKKYNFPEGVFIIESAVRNIKM